MYQLILTKKFEKSFRKLDKQVQCLIKKWIEVNLIDCDDPRVHGKALAGNLSGYWRYRIADYRLIADIQDNLLTVFAITISHRRDVYKKQSQNEH